MSIPYFARGKESHERKIEEGPIRLLLPDVQKLIGHLLTKPLTDIPAASLAGIVNGYYFSQSQIVIVDPETGDFIKGEVLWRKIIECIFELGELIVPLGKADDLYQLYLAIMEGVVEEQQDLYHTEQQIKILKRQEVDVEARFKEQMEKYFTLYEGLVKKTISFAVYCLDVITEHKDLKRKDEAGYLKDDVSYKQRKITEAAEDLQNDLEVLITGVNTHIRNSIAHKRYEYTEDGHVTFRDRNRAGDLIFEQTLSLSTFERRTKELEVNFRAQAAALLLFIHEHSEKISVRGGGSAKPKQMKLAVYSACAEAMFAPIDIRLNDGLLTCELQRDTSLDSPSTVVTNRDGVRTQQIRPPVPLRDQLLDVAIRLAETGAAVSIAALQAKDHEGNHLGRIRVNVEGLSAAMEGPPFPPIETFILESDLKEGEEAEDEE